MTERNKKLIIVIALIAAVGVSIGFAAFSSSLLIKSSLSVDPSSNEFSVVFSSSEKNLTTDDVTVSTSHTEVKATSAVIDNSGTYPTISNLGGTFTEPGQSITYTFYSMNTGKYDAYLTSIVFQNLVSGVFKECKATDGTNSDLVTSACNNIGITVQVGSEIATSTTLGISNHKLLQGASETVTITLSYESNGALADEPFTVNFGNIYLTYGTVETDEMPSLPEASICTAVNGSKSGSIELGTEYTCQVNDTTSYNFYVLSTSGDSVNLIMDRNINDQTYYFADNSNFELNVVTEDFYTIANSKPYVVTLVENLTSGWTNISDLNNYSYTINSYGPEPFGEFGTVTLTGKARLATIEELSVEEVCEIKVKKEYCSGGWYDDYCLEYAREEDYYYESCKSWAMGDYWTMSTVGAEGAWAMNTEYNTLDSFRYYLSASTSIQLFYKSGIRPVITVSISDLS